MFYYMVNWGWVDSSESKIFCHEREYSEDEFNAIITRLVNRAGRELVVEDYSCWIGNTEIIERAWELLLGEGFKELLYTAAYGMWGSNIIHGADDLEHYSEYLDAETLKAIDGHNTKIAERTSVGDIDG